MPLLAEIAIPRVIGFLVPMSIVLDVYLPVSSSDRTHLRSSNVEAAYNMRRALLRVQHYLREKLLVHFGDNIMCIMNYGLHSSFWTSMDFTPTWRSPNRDFVKWHALRLSVRFGIPIARSLLLTPAQAVLDLRAVHRALSARHQLGSVRVLEGQEAFAMPASMAFRLPVQLTKPPCRDTICQLEHHHKAETRTQRVPFALNYARTFCAMLRASALR